MSKFKFLTIIFLSILMYNCNSDESDEIFEQSFNVKYDNQDLEITNMVAIKLGDRIAVRGDASNGQLIFFEFNIYGNLAEAQTYSLTDVDFKDAYSFHYFSSHFFEFTLNELDTDNKTVKASFSGNIHEDNFDESSNTHSMVGSFSLEYTEQEPTGQISFTNAKINNSEWHGTHGDQDGGMSGYPIRVNSYSDDQYGLSIGFYPEDVEAGTYQFTANSNTSVRLRAYYPNVSSDDNLATYASEGTLIISEVNHGYGISELIGTFNFSATNSITGEVIQVTNGEFHIYF